MNNRAEEFQSKIKSWLFPSLVTVLTALIWKDISELKADVKALLAQSNIDKTRIDNIEREIYGKKVSSIITISKNSNKNNDSTLLFYNRELAITDNKERTKTKIYLKKSKNVV